MPDLVGIFSFLGGVVAGAGGSFGGKYLWQKYVKPELELHSEANAIAIHEERENSVQRIASLFRISVTNNGKTAATNCRPRIHLKSTDIPSPIEKDWVPPEPEELPENIDSDDVTKPSLEGMDFEMSTALVWSEGPERNRVNINANETVAFDLLMIDQRDRHKAEERLYRIKFPSEHGWDRPAKFYTGRSDFKIPPQPTTITKYQLDNTDWEKAHIEVTSENAEKSHGELSFDDEYGWIQVYINQ